MKRSKAECILNHRSDRSLIPSFGQVRGVKVQWRTWENVYVKTIKWTLIRLFNIPKQRLAEQRLSLGGGRGVERLSQHGGQDSG